MAQANTQDQKMAELAKHKEAHIAYWKARNTDTDPKRFEDGFIQGWCDAEDKSYPDINRDSLLAQRKNENIEHCGNSPVEWAFEHGYHEGFDDRRCLNITVEDTHEQKMAEMCKHKDAHIAYWKAHGNRPTDPQRFEDGFIQGWCDCEQHLSDITITVESLIGQRHQEHVQSHGDSECEWAFDDAYREGFEGRKCLIIKPAPPVEDTHEQKMAEMCKHKDAHIAYWKAHGNRPTDPQRFEDGFIQGWCDCEQHLSDYTITVESLIGQRHQEHVQSHGDSECEWAFDDAYREGFEGRKCMKPQQPAPPVVAPAPPTGSDCPPTEAPNPPPAAPPTTSPNPPPSTQPPDSCPPTQAPAPPNPVDCPPTTTAPPSNPPVTPAPPTNPVDTPGPNHQCTPDCNHPPITPSPPAPPAPAPAPNTPAPPPPAEHQCTSECSTNGCSHSKDRPAPPPPPAEHQCTNECSTNGCSHSKDTPAPPAEHQCTSECREHGCNHSKDRPAPNNAADLPADHQCTSECNHAEQKEGLLHRIQHNLKLD